MLEWNPLNPFGAIVAIDLSQPLDARTQVRLRELLWQHSVLVFENQSLTHDRQADIIDLFELVRRDKEGMHFVSTEAEQGGLGRGELTFHADCGFMAEPRRVLSLHAIDVVDGETSTKWISARNGLDRMPPAMRDTLGSAKALNVMPAPEYTDRLSADPVPAWVPHHWHDALIRHPQTGERLPFIMDMLTARIDGLAPESSKQLIEEALEILYDPAHVLEHVWKTGDFVIWDNVATQHARGALFGKGKRVLQKVQAGGDALKTWHAYGSPELNALLEAQTKR